MLSLIIKRLVFILVKFAFFTQMHLITAHAKKKEISAISNDINIKANTISDVQNQIEELIDLHEADLYECDLCGKKFTLKAYLQVRYLIYNLKSF